MGLIQEFKQFALKGNFFDMAIGVVIGGAFGKIVSSMIEDIIMPIVGMAGNVDFSARKQLLKGADAGVPGSSDIFLKYGSFITVIINFLILAFVLFLVVKMYNTARAKFESAPPPGPPPAPTKDQVLLTEIRDLLSRR
jgi:large conductance mechanosensitive channel